MQKLSAEKSSECLQFFVDIPMNRIKLTVRLVMNLQPLQKSDENRPVAKYTTISEVNNDLDSFMIVSEHHINPRALKESEAEKEKRVTRFLLSFR